MKDLVILGNNKLETLIALTEDEQVQGLMYRDWPPPVMSFPFNQASVHKFWMRNTISPLDIIFCRAGGIVSIASGIPLSLKLVGPDEPIDLVVELPAGTARKLNISTGDPAELRYSSQSLAKKYANYLGLDK